MVMMSQFMGWSWLYNSETEMFFGGLSYSWGAFVIATVANIIAFLFVVFGIKWFARMFTRTLAVVTAVKIVFALTFVIKNDEAYYLLWAKHLAGGYYDHPPMIGWLLHLMSYVSDSIAWHRMLAVGSGLVVVWVIYRFV